jgi:hypothetical protein
MGQGGVATADDLQAVTVFLINLPHERVLEISFPFSGCPWFDHLGRDRGVVI